MTSQMQHLSAAQVRLLIRQGGWRLPTAGLAPGYVQANLVVLPRDLADDFERFCQLNPKACPLLEKTAPGSPHPTQSAPGADVRTDLPAYCVYEYGQLVAQPHDLAAYWRNDSVAFLLGCSFTFERALLAAGIPVRHLQCNVNVPMYRTRIACIPAGPFAGPLVVSMRPMTPEQAERATRITERYRRAHGAPIHIGDPAALGIADLSRPDYGDPVPIYPGEVPVFWACGVTPQAVALAARPPSMITHKPGHMFITDLREEQAMDGS
ncbi:MAG: putative hydro-lyase [Gemmataceae bacterium]